MIVKLEDRWYADANGNQWDAAIYTQSQAERNSASLTDCWGCWNCRDCIGCRNCIGCRRCRDCIDCRDCWRCMGCDNCRYCENCGNCRDCWGCMGCEDCMICENCWNCGSCRDCVDCWKCMGCVNCMNCKNCRGYEKNPARLVGPAMGSRDANPVVYWLEGNIQCVVGCFRGDLDALEQKVRETHANNKEHLNNYMQFIKAAKRIIKELEK